MFEFFLLDLIVIYYIQLFFYYIFTFNIRIFITRYLK